ncbi:MULTISPECIES: hypothetical protein [unclassified Bosea (in: a-proteobacteria)]|nr:MULTISPECIES: hypothetical protein [unclassified Bosea (in: a-proteobacteria)]
MSPFKTNRRRGKAKPVSLPTFSFYGHLPVIYIGGGLVIGRRVIPLERSA